MTWLEDPPPWLRPAYCFASVIVWTANKNVTISQISDRFICSILTLTRGVRDSGWPDLAWGFSDLEMTWLLYCAGAATVYEFACVCMYVCMYEVMFIVVLVTRCTCRQRQNNPSFGDGCPDKIMSLLDMMNGLIFNMTTASAVLVTAYQMCQVFAITNLRFLSSSTVISFADVSKSLAAVISPFPDCLLLLLSISVFLLFSFFCFYTVLIIGSVR